ncbi:MAG: UDP-2,3-diacylglucosamine hydrolase [Planctomycetota bacterium]
MVIADLHLNPEGDGVSRAFLDWLDALQAPRLVVLGDLFDTWIGPKQRRIPGSAAVVEALGRLVARGVELHVVPGNRDFLLGADLEAWTGAEVHAQGLVIESSVGGRSLLVHGDELCTLDLGYQAYKRRIQAPLMRRWLPRLPLGVLRKIAERLRANSERSVPRKGDQEKSMQADAALELLREAGAEHLICGHAHRYRDENSGSGEDALHWIVLDGWGGERDTLLWQADIWQGRAHRSVTSTVG